MSRVAIIGVGLIGRAWAQVFARAGWDVSLWDPDGAALAAAPAQIAEGLAESASQGLAPVPASTGGSPGGDAGTSSATSSGTATETPGASAPGRVTIAASLEAAVAGADFVQENGPEDVAIKNATFARLDRAAPAGTVLASSTSAIVASRFTEALAGRHRCLVGHPVNPPHLVPVVEICGAPWTDAGACDRARAVYEAVGQVPITVRREIDGFILNRLQGALLAEAFRLVGEGYCSPEDLDQTLAAGLGRRWAFMGPFATIELNAPGGIPDYCERYTGFYRRLQTDPAPPTVWDRPNWERIVSEWTGSPTAAGPGTGTASGQPSPSSPHAAKSHWRDNRLAALAVHLNRQPGWPGQDH